MTQTRRTAFRELTQDRWDGFLKGVEKEGLRVDRDGFIAQTPHPEALGSALTHPAITTDYSESLLELITPVYSSTRELLASLTDVHTYVQMNLGDELMWSASMPCRLDGDPSIPMAEYGTSNVGRLKHVYRQGLAVRYGRVMQSIAGVHYNFSLPDSFWQRWQQQLGDQQPMQDFKTEQYFWLIRNFRRRCWLLMVLFGSSPAIDASFVKGRSHRLKTWEPDSLYSPTATSLRMGDLGYHNHAQSSLDICFNRLDTYTRTLDRAIHTPWPAYQEIGEFRGDQRIQINTNVLQIENEYSSAMRPKRTTRSGEKPLAALEDRGVEYVEVRCLDLDPFSPIGMSESQVDFLDLFLLDCLIEDSPVISDEECEVLDNGFRDVVAQGRDRSLSVAQGDDQGAWPEVAERLLQRLESLAETLPDAGHYVNAIAVQRARLGGEGKLMSERVLSALEESGQSFVDWTLALSDDHQRNLRARGLPPADYEAMADAARQSLREQRDVEAAETEPFETFLARYLAE